MDDDAYRRRLDYQNRLTKQRRERRRKAEICTYCGKAQAEQGYFMCAQCKKNLASRNKSAYWERKAKGICVTCGAVPAQAGRTCCFNCGVKNSERVKKYFSRRAEECQS